MTRINLLIPSALTDQHLIAEIKEINQLAGHFKRSINSASGIHEDDIPKEFTLNTGHVKFFYNKGAYLHERFNLLREEALFRGFDIKAQFNNVWVDECCGFELYKTWIPKEKDLFIIKERIREKIKIKPNWYKYHGVIINSEKYIRQYLN